MATCIQHTERARSNEKLADLLSDSAYQDWRVIASFYAALHYIEAVIAQNGEEGVSHQRRKGLIHEIPALRPIGGLYEALRDHARRARYDAAYNYCEKRAQTTVVSACSILPRIKAALNIQP